MRDMTVRELRELLAEYPDHTRVAPFVGKTAGVLTAARLTSDPHGTVLLIGECDLPFDLIEADR